MKSKEKEKRYEKEKAWSENGRGKPQPIELRGLIDIEGGAIYIDLAPLPEVSSIFYDRSIIDNCLPLDRRCSSVDD